MWEREGEREKEWKSEQERGRESDSAGRLQNSSEGRREGNVATRKRERIRRIVREGERRVWFERGGARVTPAASRRVTQSSGHGSEEAREEAAVSSQLPFYAATVASAT